jgi:hypothetical protein
MISQETKKYNYLGKYYLEKLLILIVSISKPTKDF